MRPRFLISILILALLILVVVFWLRPTPLHTSNERPEETVQSNVPAASVNVANQSVPGVTQPTVPTNVHQYAPSKMTLPQLAEKLIEEKNMPMDFYGEVIDQDSNALSGVDIKVAVRHWTVMDPTVVEYGLGSKEIRLERVTGPDGRFELNGATGDVFDLESIQKDGYDLEPGKRTFGVVGGSFENPVIFKMWSVNIHEQLVTGEKKFQIVPDGRPYFINLTDGTISESGTGDLRVWIQYTNQVTRGQTYDWSAGIEVLNGGLLEEPVGTAMYEAPTEGYASEFQSGGKLRGGQRGQIEERQFYLQLKNGQEYGQMSINLIAPYNFGIPGLVRLSYAINPSGSRILR